MAKRTTKKVIHEADANGKMKFSSPLDLQVKQVEQEPVLDIYGLQPEPAPETADAYIAREYGEAIKAGNIARILEGILVEIVKWRMAK